MHRILLTCVCAGAALAQTVETGPIEAAVQAVRAVRVQGRYAEAAALRTTACKILEGLPSTADAYPRWVAAVAELYSEGGRTVEARAVVLRAVELRPRRTELLMLAADAWERDGNLVQAAAFLERARQEGGPLRAGVDWRLADLYRRMGRGEAVVARLGRDPGEPPAFELLDQFGGLRDSPTIYQAANMGQANAASAQLVDAMLNAAHQAARAGHIDDAFVFGLRVIDEGAGDESVIAGIPLLASRLASEQARGMAEQLWDRLLALVGSQSADTLVPLLQVSRVHARFLAECKACTVAAWNALVRYRDLLTMAHGTASEELAGVLRMMVEFHLDRGAPMDAAAAAEELLALEDALSGSEGAANLRAIETAAGLYEVLGNRGRVRELHRRAVSIADLVYEAGDSRRATVRLRAAYALAHQGEFDEAQRLAREAVALDEMFQGDLEQIVELRG